MDLTETENKDLNLADLKISKSTFNAIIDILSQRQNVFQKELEDREKAKEKSSKMIEEIQEKGIGEKELENLKYLQSSIFKSADNEFYKHHKKELIHQEDVIEFLNTFTDKVWEKLDFNHNEE